MRNTNFAIAQFVQMPNCPTLNLTLKLTLFRIIIAVAGSCEGLQGHQIEQPRNKFNLEYKQELTILDDKPKN